MSVARHMPTAVNWREYSSRFRNPARTHEFHRGYRSAGAARKTACAHPVHTSGHLGTTGNLHRMASCCAPGWRQACT
eukprot:365750-Chlamydomonas_euryale.AAC.10